MTPAEPSCEERSPGPPLDVLYDAGSCLAVNKPAGVLTQAPQGIDSMEERVRRHWQLESERSYHVYVGVPHRLDRPVSGALVFTRNIRATQRLARQFEQRTVHKFYVALVEGRPPAGAEWRDSLRKVAGRAWVEVVLDGQPGAKEARLSYQLLTDYGKASLVLVQPQTGRTHQIRVQFAHRGFPVLGDDQYGARQAFGRAWNDPRQRSIALHARRLCFRHPTLPHAVDLRAPLGPDWHAFSETMETSVAAWEQANRQGPS